MAASASNLGRLTQYVKNVLLSIRRLLVQTQLVVQSGVGSQPRYEAASDLRIENEELGDEHGAKEAILLQNVVVHKQFLPHIKLCFFVIPQRKKK